MSNLIIQGAAGAPTADGLIQASNFATSTVDATGANLTVPGNLTVQSNTNLGAVGNVHITGGSSGQVLQTDGSGTLQWASPSATSIANGNSNVAIAAANGNITLSAEGNANVLTVTGVGANIAGTLNATGNANVGNLGAATGVFTTVVGEGGNLSNIQGANVSGTVPLANNASYLGTQAAANYLLVTGSGSQLTAVTGANVTGQVGNALIAGTVYTAAQPNITSVGTLTQLAVSGTTNLNAVGNITITGGTNAQALTTNGSGVLQWSTVGDVTLTGTQTLTNKTITAPTITGATLNDGYTEEVYAVVDAAGVALSPTNGSVQTWTLGASRTPTAGTWAAGQSMILMINDGTAYTVTWTTLAVTWVGGTAPTLATSGYSVVTLWKVGTTIYGSYIGDVA